MKNFSAQSYTHKEFSLVEFKSELDALELINNLPSHVKLLDMFSLLNQNFVAFLTCQNLKNVYESLRAHPSALDGYFTNDTIIETLNAFYYLNKPIISEALIVLESERLSQIFSVMDKAHRSELQILDLKNQKSHTKNTLYLTGTLEKIQKFENDLKNTESIQFKVLNPLNEILKDYLS